ncbi:MAG: hypothetical protein M1832_000783 [Thelocarpon impressellum]|nr:MAG: hypothetical protein M1832_000783 [Thelocarpon impressellum]
MDQLREWLGPFVDGICRDAVTWDEEGVGSSQESGAGSCRRHGDLCWVQITKAHLSGLRKVVQIQEFLTYEDPIKAVLSDSFTVIECVFSPSGEKAFRQSHQGQRITQHTQGGNLALKWFNLLIPMTGTPMSKFRLLIHDCQYLGSGGSALFGRPIAIETRTGMAGIVRNLSVHLSRQSGGMRTSSDGGKGIVDAEQQLMGELQSFASSPNLVGPNQKTVITQDYQRAGDRGRLREPESDADESDLETSVPNALGDEPLKDEDPSEHEVAIPVDRAGQSHAVLQVERTPHMRGNSAEAAVVEVISDSQIRPAPSRADGAVAVRAGKKRRFFEDSESPVTGSKTTKSCVGWSRCSNVESSRIRSPQEPGIHHTPGVVLASSVTRKSPASGRATGNDTTRTLSQQASRRVISPPEVKRAPQVVPPALARGEGSDILTSPDETSKSGGRGKAVTSQERPWWTDKNTPFKRFSREYARLKAVDGELGEVDEKRGGLIPVRTRVDVLSWDI